MDRLYEILLKLQVPPEVLEWLWRRGWLPGCLRPVKVRVHR